MKPEGNGDILPDFSWKGLVMKTTSCPPTETRYLALLSYEH